MWTHGQQKSWNPVSFSLWVYKMLSSLISFFLFSFLLWGHTFVRQRFPVHEKWSYENALFFPVRLTKTSIENKGFVTGIMTFGVSYYF